MTERTIRFHISNLLRKTDTKTQLELVTQFYRAPTPTPTAARAALPPGAASLLQT